VGKPTSPYGANRILNIFVLLIWACAFLFLLNGERYRYFLGPAFGVSLVTGFFLSAAMCIALGKNNSPSHAVPWVSTSVRALVLLLPLIYAVGTSGTVLDAHTFTKRWAGVGSRSITPQKTDLSPNIPEIQEADDNVELVEAYRTAGPTQVPRALRNMLGIQTTGEHLSKKMNNRNEKKVIEADLYDLAEYADKLKGKQVATEGMAAWDENDNSRFYLFRFLVVCCVADAQPLAVLVDIKETEMPRQNTWVRVEGLVDTIKVDGQAGVIIRKASVTSIKAPKDPYLY